jgi:2-oxoisovalerate dehydrogenase E1 component
MQTVASNLTQLCFDDLDGPPVVIGARNWITPAAELEAMFFPQTTWILDALHERVLPLRGHQPRTKQALATLVDREKLGI